MGSPSQQTPISSALGGPCLLALKEDLEVAKADGTVPTQLTSHPWTDPGSRSRSFRSDLTLGARPGGRVCGISPPSLNG